MGPSDQCAFRPRSVAASASRSAGGTREALTLLSSVSLKQPVMPPSAILMVCDMADPLPGRFTRGFASAARARADWDGAAKDLGYVGQALLSIGAAAAPGFETP